MNKRMIVFGNFLVFSLILIASSVDGSIVVEKNNQIIVDLEKIDSSKIPYILDINRIYFFGIISNLEFDENVTYFDAIILWKLYVHHYDSTWDFDCKYYSRFQGIAMVDMNFKGILTPFFICGYFT